MTLKEIRQNLGYQQQGLALLCKVNSATLSKIEKGKSRPSLEVALRLAKALHISHRQFDLAFRHSAQQETMREETENAKR